MKKKKKNKTEWREQAKMTWNQLERASTGQTGNNWNIKINSDCNRLQSFDTMSLSWYD